MSALSIDYGTGFVPQAPRVMPAVPRAEHLADVIQLPPSRVQVPQPRAVAQPIRLTARGKLMVRAISTLLAVIVSIGLGASLGFALRAPSSDVGVVIVEPGQSLWSIGAAAAAPGQDVRDVVAQIVELNSLTSSIIASGEELTIPVR